MVKGQVCIWTKWPSGRNLSRFQWHEVTGSISTPPWVRWQSIKELPPALNSPAAIYTPGWREALWEWSDLPKNTAQCPRPRLEPRPFNLEWSALTMRLLNLSQTLYSWLTAKAKYCFQWHKLTRANGCRQSFCVFVLHVTKVTTPSFTLILGKVSIHSIRTSLQYDCFFKSRYLPASQCTYLTRRF